MSNDQSHPSIEDLIEGAIVACYPDDWQEENFITRSWLRALRDQCGRKPLRWHNGVSFIFDCQKMTGSLEHAHGDIGILVKISAPGGASMTGLATLEAKRTYPGRAGFKYPELKRPQLERQLAHSAQHRLVLYSHAPTTDNTMHAVTLPSQVGLLCIDDAQVMEGAGVSLGSQIVRYLQGWDLDFSVEKVSRVLNGDIRFEHILKVHVGLTRTVSLSLAVLRVPDHLYMDIDVPEIDLDLGVGGPLPEPPSPDRGMGGFSL